MPIHFSITDFFLPAIYLFILSGITLQCALKQSTILKKYYLLGFTTKFLGLLCYVSLSIFFFQEGDTFLYYEGASQIWNSFLNSPLEGLNSLMLSSGEFYISSFNAKLRFIYFDAPNEWFLIKLAGIANIFAFNNYLCLSMLFCYFSFCGLWALFKRVASWHPDQNPRVLFILFFLMPSSLIWTSGLLKDTICFGLVGFILNSFFVMVDHKRINFQLLIQILLWIPLWKIKPYIASILFISLLTWVCVHIYQTQQNTQIKRLIIACLTLLVFASFSQINLVIAYLEKQEEYHFAFSKIKAYHSEYERVKATGASVYTLGEVEYTPLGVLQKMPEAIATTLFRPYPWEITKSELLLPCIENIYLLLLFIYLLLKGKRSKTSINLWKQPTFIMSFVFITIFSFLVGLISYNFGLLMRLKTPIFPFLGIIFFLINTSKTSNSPTK